LIGLGLAAAIVAIGAVAWILLAPPPELDEARFAALVKNHQYDEAEREIRASMRPGGRNPGAAFLLGQLMLEQRELPAGTTQFQRASEALELLTTCEDAPGIEQFATRAVIKYYLGKALYQLNRWGEAETDWVEALKRDARVPEASWSLLDLYYLEDRRREARELVLRVYPAEPDPRDRAQLLLELMRQDAIRPGSPSLIRLFEPVVSAEPNVVSIRRALGLALVRSSPIDDGLAILEKLANEHSDDAEAWDGWLEALDLTGSLDEFRAVYDRVPEAVRATGLFARHRALAAQIDGDWKTAAEAGEEAVAFDPTDFGLLVRLAQAKKFIDPEQGRVLDEAIAAWREASNRLSDLYKEANQTSMLGVAPHPDLCERLAASREAMGRPDEAALWRQLGPGVMNPPQRTRTLPLGLPRAG
jgi:tetratricopeptide (TPR) repeat protein